MALTLGRQPATQASLAGPGMGLKPAQAAAAALGSTAVPPLTAHARCSAGLATPGACTGPGRALLAGRQAVQAGRLCKQVVQGAASS